MSIYVYITLSTYNFNQGIKDISFWIEWDGGTTIKRSRMAISFHLKFLSWNDIIAGRLRTSLGVHANVKHPSPPPKIY